MKHINFTTSNVCARQIDFDIDENGYIHNVVFLGGCNGNLQGISKLTEGMNAEEVIKRCEGIKCGFKNTSCPDQLALALKAAMEQK